jgi:hypothetical protein
VHPIVTSVRHALESKGLPLIKNHASSGARSSCGRIRGTKNLYKRWCKYDKMCA